MCKEPEFPYYCASCGESQPIKGSDGCAACGKHLLALHSYYVQQDLAEIDSFEARFGVGSWNQSIENLQLDLASINCPLYPVDPDYIITHDNGVTEVGDILGNVVFTTP